MKKLFILVALSVGAITLQACKDKPEDKEEAATLGVFDDIKNAFTPKTYRTAPDPAGDLIRQMGKK